MGRLRLLVLVVFAVLVVGVVWVAGASASQGLPTALSSATIHSKAVSLNAPVYTLTNGNKVECTTATTGESEETSEHAGTFHIKFLGCVGELSGAKAKCTGLGDSTTGEILTLGHYDLVYDTGSTELGVAILFLVEPTHFTCLGIFLNVVEGEQVCLILEPYVEKTLHEMVCESSSGGVQKETYLNDNGETVSPKLTVTEGESTKVNAAESAKALLLWVNASGTNIKVVFHMT